MAGNHKYLALLRGINVGGNHTVSMSSLKELFIELGFSEVLTYINSGNVIFSSDQTDIVVLTKQLESALSKSYGFSIPVVIVRAEDLLHLASQLPAAWTNDKEQRTEILFLWEQYDSPGTVGQLHTNPRVDQLMYIKGAIAWHFDRVNYRQSGIAKIIGTDIYKHMTARNINTVRKLAEILSNQKNNHL